MKGCIGPEVPTRIKVSAPNAASSSTAMAVDGQPTADLKLDEVVNLVRGPEGTPVSLGVQRAGSGQVDHVLDLMPHPRAPSFVAKQYSSATDSRGRVA